MSDAPLVSLLLLAYNQEGFVRRAVEGAFAQDYPNLEVVLSDDDSKDRTFAIMQEMTAAYKGPHRVILNQMKPNAGPLPHLYHAVRLSSGGLIVGAAGDDISYTNRVSRLSDLWQRTGADGVFSDLDLMDETDALVPKAGGRVPSEIGFDGIFPGRGAVVVVGASAAYSRRLFEAVPLPSVRIMAEDLFFSLMLAWRCRKVASLDEPLLAYRVHQGSSTTVADTESLAFERKVETVSAITADILEHFEQMLGSGAGLDATWGEPALVDLKRLRAEARFFRFRSQWLSRSPAQRMRALLAVRSQSHRRWLLPRLFGPTLPQHLRRLRHALSRPRAVVPPAAHGR